MSDSGRKVGECLAPADATEPAAVQRAGQAIVRFRVLPHGEFREALHFGWKGRTMELDLQGQDVAPGALLEIESGSMLYLGELSQRDGPVVAVRVEHSLDRAKLATDRDHWG
jgi:hypothetical protein